MVKHERRKLTLTTINQFKVPEEFNGKNEKMMERSSFDWHYISFDAEKLVLN